MEFEPYLAVEEAAMYQNGEYISYTKYIKSEF